MKSMNDLMLHFLQDMYDAEKRGVRGMQKIAKAAANEEVKEAVLQHRDQSQQQVSRLERVFEMVGKRPRGKTCRAMEGLSDEVDEAIEDGEKGPVLDAALIASAQAIEHYEIARYGAMVAWARRPGWRRRPGCSGRRWRRRSRAISASTRSRCARPTRRPRSSARRTRRRAKRRSRRGAAGLRLRARRRQSRRHAARRRSRRRAGVRRGSRSPQPDPLPPAGEGDAVPWPARYVRVALPRVGSVPWMMRASC